MKKSILALLLAVLMVASLLPAAAMADGEAVAKIGEDEFNTLEEAITAAGEGDEIVILKGINVSSAATIDINKAVTIDFANHAFTGYSLHFTSGNSTIKNGSLTSADETVIVEDCGLTIENMYITSTVSHAVFIGNNYSGHTGNKGSVTINGSNTVISGGYCGVFITGPESGSYNSDSYSSLTVNGGEIAGRYFGISGNGTYDSTVITINGGEIITTDPADSAGVYHSQDGLLYVNGGTIKGHVGIQMAAGKAEISGGTIMSTDNTKRFDPYKNAGESDGNVLDGSALSVVSRSGWGDVGAEITGGSFIVSNTENEAIKMYGYQKSGGQFQVIDPPTNANLTAFDGSFNTPVKADYLANNLAFEVNNNGTYTYYETFDDALNAAEYGAEITDIAEGIGTPYYDLVIDPANGGEVKSVNAPSGSTFTLPTVSKSGYAFLGWSDGVNTYPAGTVITLTSNVTYTASWVRHPDTPYVPEPEEPEEPEVPAFPFYDVPTSAWYYTAVKYVYDNKLMDGVDTYEFAPNATLTRAMVWTIIARMSGVDTTGGNSWYAKAQEWVITKGISDGENPTAAITREEFVTMLWRLAGEPIYTGDLSRVPDAGSISTWAQNAMLWSYATGLTEGDENGALTPLATATRAQAAAMIMRFCESVK